LEFAARAGDRAGVDFGGEVVNGASVLVISVEIPGGARCGARSQ